jgi:hypothetical protein
MALVAQCFEPEFEDGTVAAKLTSSVALPFRFVISFISV